MSRTEPMRNQISAVATVAVATDPARWCRVAVSVDGVRFAIMSADGCEAQVTLSEAEATLLAQTLQVQSTPLAAE